MPGTCQSARIWPTLCGFYKPPERNCWRPLSRIDADAASAAQDQYRHAISQVRVELSRLHTLVAPDQYASLCRQVISATLPDDTSRLYVWELENPGEGISL